MRKTLIAILLIGMASYCASAWADILHMKNGKSIEGRVVKETEEGIVFEVEGASMSFSHSEIESVETKDYTAPRPRRIVKPQSVAPSSPTHKQKNWWERLIGGLQGGRTKLLSGMIDPEDEWMVLIIIAILQFVVAALTAKMYLSISHLTITMWQTLFFQLKWVIVGSILSWVGVFAFGMMIGEVSSEDAISVALMANAIYIFINSVCFYVIAKRDLDVEFISAVFLGIVIGITYFLVENAAQRLGLEYENFLELAVARFVSS